MIYSSICNKVNITNGIKIFLKCITFLTLWRSIQSSKQTCPQQKEPSASDTPQNHLIKCPNDTQCSQTVLKVRHTSEPTDKKSPNSTLCSKEMFALPRTGGLAQSWGCSAHPDTRFRSWRSTHQLAVSAKLGRNRENSQNKRFCQLPGTFPPKPLRGLASQEQWAPHSPPNAPSITATALQVVGGWW